MMHEDMATGEGGVATAAVRPPRADAVRNRYRILEAAEAAFAEEGLGVPVDDIAARAGVGAGTLYRHFPTKEALYEAVLAHHMDALAEEARRLASAGSPGQALFDYLSYLSDQGSSKRNLIEGLSDAGIDIKKSLASHKEAVEEAAGELLRAAQAHGDVRSDVSLNELFGLVMGICTFAEPDRDAESRARMLSVVVSGLRP